MILVTGATGTVGRELVAELARRGAKVRALSRTPAATAFPAGVETVAADLGDPATLGPALAGIERVFILAAGPARLDHEISLTAAARHAVSLPTAAWLAAAVPIVFWGGEFGALLVPGTDPSPDPANPNTFPLLGAHVHGNLFFSACMMAFSLLGSVLLITG